MLVSWKWLKEYVPLHTTPEELADRLTMSGLEVESISEKRPSFTNVVVSRLVSVKPHPSADACVLCEVTTGARTYPVVCSATNIKEGDVVPLALVGATIPGGYTIRASKIRGEVSEGMLCSEAELGIGNESSGVMVLPDHLSLGEDLATALDLRDVILDISITPNRADCLSIVGIAREISAITGAPFSYPSVKVIEEGEDIRQVTSVTILDPDLCPRYSARVINDVTIQPSPLWMRQRLEAVGLRPINNVVDVTNYVMMELGQPLHAFDFSFLEEGRIVVRRSKEEERFTSLDEKERVLRPDTIMICDGRKPVAIGGIMGGLNSEVKEDTTRILLESAYFEPSSIRKSARWLGMSTDAALRFGRGVDIEGVVRALDRAAQLIAELAGGTICRGYIDEYPKKVAVASPIVLRTQRVNEILGTDLTGDEIEGYLGRLEMRLEREKVERYRVIPPTYRVDITREIDLIEEIARLHGYEKIPVTIPPVSAKPVVKDRKETVRERIREILMGSGCSEVITYSFISPSSVDILSFHERDERRKLVKIQNPLTEDQSVLRTTLVYSLLEIMKKNVHAGCPDLKIFEMGRVFYSRGEGNLPEEKERLGCLFTGARARNFWSAGVEVDFYDLKGCLETVFEGFRISNVRFASEHKEPFLHPGKCCGMFIKDQLMGFAGEVHPDVLMKMDIKNRVYVCEVDLELLVKNFIDVAMYRELPRFPSVVRDVAFLVDDRMEARGILEHIMGQGKELLENVSIFDVYSGKSIPSGKKSLGLRFTYRAPDRTLTDDEVNEVHGEIVRSVVKHLGVAVRGQEQT